MLPFDLHVLSIPPAFNLSHDQTLQFNYVTLCPKRTSCSKKLLFGIDFIETVTSNWFNFVDFKLCKFFKAFNCAAFKSTHTDCFSSLQFVLELSAPETSPAKLGARIIHPLTTLSTVYFQLLETLFSANSFFISALRFSLEADAHYTARIWPVNTLKIFILNLFKACSSCAFFTASSLEADAHYTLRFLTVNTLKIFYSNLFKALPFLALTCHSSVERGAHYRHFDWQSKAFLKEK
jgi:hypothetical protein